MGVRLVAGVDEAGRGALAGPVCAAVVLLPVDDGMCRRLSGVRDSKKLSAQARTHWANQIKACALDFGVGFASNLEIDTLGILPATHLAVQRALAQLKSPPQHLLVDYLPKLSVSIPLSQLVKGDSRCLSIACASVLAKTARDALMCQYAAEFPGYGFQQHKGYGTSMHRQMLLNQGPSALHRMSFAYKTADLEKVYRP